MSTSESEHVERRAVTPPEFATQSSPALEDPRVVVALEQYLAAIETGERPNRQAFLARHAEVAEALAECLDGMEALYEAASIPTHPTDEAGLKDLGVEWQPEAPLGDFRIVREIGRGGMGIVYEAVQLSLGRRVALKVLPFAAALDAKQLQRFKNEAHAAAHLHHTNIVPVYAVGSERGVHFYAMQLIEGQNLASLISHLRRGETADGPGDPRPRSSPEATGPYLVPPGPAAKPAVDTGSGLGAQLSTQRSDRTADFFRTVARLIAQAAEGLEYAHGLGVIHRDVKPANLLVDEHGNVWITDFGLAQFHSDGALTQTGDLLGTLRYMSPEQAGGQRVLIDHRTDVYSLGATLYEFLTLRPIFDGGDRQTLLNQIMNADPISPRSADRSIPPELETIVLKATAKVPAERYTSAREFADDLHRFLRHEPVRARRATPIQRARKWLRRHPAVPVAGALLLVLLAAGSLVSAWLIQSEHAKTQLAYDQERARAEEARQQFQLARRVVDELIQLSEQDLADKPHMEGLRQRFLEAALAYYQEFIEQRRDDLDTQQELAATQARIKQIVEDLAMLQGAGDLFLLAEPAVLHELLLSPEQRERVTELSHRLAEQRPKVFKGFHRLTPEMRRQPFLELARANEAAVADILTPEQRRRLRQIGLQLRGPSVFLESDVSTKLKLTAEQMKRVRAIEAEVFFGKPDRLCAPPGPRPGPGPGRGLRNARRAHEQDIKSASDKILRLLTEDQRRQWQDMTGKPFVGDVTMRPPGPFSPPGSR
jgi:serine/threonine protein kinase